MDLARSGDWRAVVPGAAHYRPVALQLFYGVGLTLFGFNPLGYHLLEFAAFSLTVILVFHLASRFLQDEFKAWAAAFFYALNISLFGNFYWIATSYFSLGGLFYFLSVYFYLRPGKIAALATLLAVTAALLTNELALTLPLLFCLISGYRRFWPGRLLAGAGVALSYLIVKLVLIGTPAAPDYAFAFSGRVLAAARWYFWRVLNLPEGVNRTTDWVILVLFGLLVAALAAGAVVFRRKISGRRIFFGISWFVIGALPFFFLPGHLSAYYLTMALFGTALIFAEILGHDRKLAAGAMLIYLLLTIRGLDFLRGTHWMILKNTGPIGQF
jgi:hypothetical protein